MPLPRPPRRSVPVAPADRASRDSKQRRPVAALRPADAVGRPIQSRPNRSRSAAFRLLAQRTALRRELEQVMLGVPGGTWPRQARLPICRPGAAERRRERGGSGKCPARGSRPTPSLSRRPQEPMTIRDLAGRQPRRALGRQPSSTSCERVLALSCSTRPTVKPRAAGLASRAGARFGCQPASIVSLDIRDRRAGREGGRWPRRRPIADPDPRGSRRRRR